MRSFFVDKTTWAAVAFDCSGRGYVSSFQRSIITLRQQFLDLNSPDRYRSHHIINNTHYMEDFRHYYDLENFKRYYDLEDFKHHFDMEDFKRHYDLLIEQLDSHCQKHPQPDPTVDMVAGEENIIDKALTFARNRRLEQQLFHRKRKCS